MKQWYAHIKIATIAIATIFQILHSMKLSVLSWTVMLCVLLPPKAQSGPLSSEERPVEYHLEPPGHTIMYVPVLQMIQETDILNMIRESNAEPGQFMSYCDCGSKQKI